MQKSTVPKKITNKERNWFLIDAKDQVLGRLSVEAANRLRGKYKKNYIPNVDNGDHVVIYNAAFIKVLGNKEDNEYVYNHSTYLGGLRKRSYKEMINKYSDELITNAILNMLPRNYLSSKMMNRCHVFKTEIEDNLSEKQKNFINLEVRK
ncbi:MAG: 50S ribosomal protein L13 [Mycoplasmoidaceae bacterium]